MLKKFIDGLKMDKKGFMGAQWLVALVVAVALILIFTPALYSMTKGGTNTIKLGQSCKVGGLGEGTCKESCNPETEFPSPLECDVGVCCIKTGITVEEELEQRAGVDNLLPCETPGSIDECKDQGLDRAICSEQKFCISWCSYCALNVGKTIEDSPVDCGDEFTASHSCSCTKKDVDDLGYHSISGYCPSTNPGDDNFMCCKKKLTEAERLMREGVPKETAERKEDWNDFVFLIKDCIKEEISPSEIQDSSCLGAATKLKRDLITGPEWYVLLLNGENKEDGISKIKLVREVDGKSEYLFEEELNVELCTCRTKTLITCGKDKKIGSVFNSYTLWTAMKLYHEDEYGEGLVYYDADGYDETLNTFETYEAGGRNLLCASSGENNLDEIQIKERILRMGPFDKCCYCYCFYCFDINVSR